MSTRDKTLAVLVSIIWGLNFLAVRVALDAFPPFFLAALRYVLVAIPVLLIVPRPLVSARWLIGYGLGFGVLQFGLLFLAIDLGMPSGLSAVVLQAGAPMAVVLGVLLLGERPGRQVVIGSSIAVMGLILVGVERAEGGGRFLPFALTLLAALGWALGSLSARLAQPDSALRFALWVTTVPPIPLLVLSAVMEGTTTGWVATMNVVRDIAVAPLAAVAYIVVLGTVVGTVLWSSLLTRYPASVVAPFSMLVPVISMAAAWFVLNEQPSAVAVLGAAVILLGVAVGMMPGASAPRRGLVPDPVDH